MGAEGGSPECNKSKCLILCLRECVASYVFVLDAQSLVYMRPYVTREPQV